MTNKDRYIRQATRLLWLGEKLAILVSKKDREYGSSWRKRGGVGAFFIMARKWDRIEQACANTDFERDRPLPDIAPAPYDIFDRFRTDNREEGIADDVVDLMGYLLVLLEHMIDEGHIGKIFGVDVMRNDVTGDLDGNIRPPHHFESSVTGKVEHPFGYDEEDDALPERKEPK